jgi:cytoskeleton protein RodZ
VKTTVCRRKGNVVEEDKSSSSPAPEVTIPEVSLRLQHSREAKGLSLREAEAATRIPVYYLQLLEGKGDARLLSDVLYLVPFLRTYAVFLGLDPAETTAQFVRSVSTTEDPLSELGEPRPPSRSSIQLRALIVPAIIILLTLLWFIFRY